jgi:hypothetical protein
VVLEIRHKLLPLNITMVELRNGKGEARYSSASEDHHASGSGLFQKLASAGSTLEKSLFAGNGQCSSSPRRSSLERERCEFVLVQAADANESVLD